MNKRQTLSKRCHELELENKRLKDQIYFMNLVKSSLEDVQLCIHQSQPIADNQFTLEETTKIIDTLSH